MNLREFLFGKPKLEALDREEYERATIQGENERRARLGMPSLEEEERRFQEGIERAKASAKAKDPPVITPPQPIGSNTEVMPVQKVEAFLESIAKPDEIVTTSQPKESIHAKVVRLRLTEHKSFGQIQKETGIAKSTSAGHIRKHEAQNCECNKK